MSSLLFAHIFKEMSDARLLFHLALLEDNRKLIDSNILGNLLKLYKVINMSVASAEICAVHVIWREVLTMTDEKAIT